MNDTAIISAIDAEISKLQEARKLLTGTPDILSTLTKRRGRPPGTRNKPKAVVNTAKPKRTMSAEGRAKIAEAQRKRHASKKRAYKKAAQAEVAG